MSNERNTPLPYSDRVGGLKGLAVQANKANKLVLLSAVVLILSACTIDENGMRDPVSEAKAAATRQAAGVLADKASYELETKRLAQKAEAQASIARAEAEAYQVRAQADIDLETARALASEKARILTAFSIGLSGVLLGLSACAVMWVGTRGAIALMYANRDSGYVKIGVEPGTLLPPPLVFTVDGYMIDTRSGERAKLRDGAEVNRLRLAATTHSTDLAIMAQAAERIARQKHQAAAQVAQDLPTIAASLPMLDISEVGNV